MINFKKGQKLLLKKNLLGGGYLAGDEVEVFLIGDSRTHLRNKRGELISFENKLIADSF